MTRREPGQPFSKHNPIILSPDDEGMYVVWCRKCGFERTGKAPTLGQAKVLQANHMSWAESRGETEG